MRIEYGTTKMPELNWKLKILRKCSMQIQELYERDEKNTLCSEFGKLFNLREEEKERERDRNWQCYENNCLRAWEWHTFNKSALMGQNIEVLNEEMCECG